MGDVQIRVFNVWYYNIENVWSNLTYTQQTTNYINKDKIKVYFLFFQSQYWIKYDFLTRVN